MRSAVRDRNQRLLKSVSYLKSERRGGVKRVAGPSLRFPTAPKCQLGDYGGFAATEPPPRAVECEPDLR